MREANQKELGTLHTVSVARRVAYLAGKRALGCAATPEAQ